MKNKRIHTLTALAMLSAISFAVTFLMHALPIVIVPALPFLHYDPKDVVIALGGLIWGPGAAALVSVTVSVLEMVTISTTGWIGCIMNILSSCAFACPAAWIYQKRKNLSGAVIGLATGSLAMIAVMLLWNYLLTPLYMSGVTREAIVGMLIPAFLPFNALKAALNASFTFLLYKPVIGALRKARLIPASSGAPRKNPIGMWILAAGVIVTCVFFILALKGIL